MLHFLCMVVNRNFTTKRFQGYCKATKYYRINGDPHSLSSQSSLDVFRKRSQYWIVAKWLNMFLADMAGPRPLRLAPLGVIFCGSMYRMVNAPCFGKAIFYCGAIGALGNIFVVPVNPTS
jgi:hypothetical protein